MHSFQNKWCSAHTVACTSKGTLQGHKWLDILYLAAPIMHGWG